MTNDTQPRSKPKPDTVYELIKTALIARKIAAEVARDKQFETDQVFVDRIREALEIDNTMTMKKAAEMASMSRQNLHKLFADHPRINNKKEEEERSTNG